MYIGNVPGENFISFSKQSFTIVNSQTAYTLDFPVNDGNDIRLVINNVIQEPGGGKAYTAAGNTLTLSEALTNGTDEMYCVFLGKARETVTVPTITKDKVDFISDGTGSGIISKGDGGSVDGSISLNCSQNSHHTRISSSSHSSYAGNLNFVLPNSHGSNGQFLKTDGSGNLSFADAGGNTPSFAARMSSAQSISNNTLTKIDFDTEEFDSDGAYDHSTNQRFTVPSGKAGKYAFYVSAILDAAGHTQLQRCRIAIYKNGSMIKMRAVNFNSNDIYYIQLDISAALDLSVGDYIEAYARINDASGNPVIDGSATENSTFYGFKLG